MGRATRVVGLLLAATAVLDGCAGPRPAPEPAPLAVDLPTPGLTPVFLRESQLPAGARESEQWRCIDEALQDRDLNDFGEPKGTVYSQGAPLGVQSTADRYRYVRRAHPDIGVLCTKAPGEP
jgi:hypothetical protein